jgi:hypothetical protein
VIVAVGSTREGILSSATNNQHSLVMAASDNNAARLWDAASGKSIAEPMVTGWVPTALRDGRRHPWDAVIVAGKVHSEQQELHLVTQRSEQALNPRNVRLKSLGISLTKSLVDLQRFLKSLACFVPPVLIYIKNCQKVQCPRHFRKVGVRVLFSQLPVFLECLLKPVACFFYRVLISIKDTTTTIARMMNARADMARYGPVGRVMVSSFALGTTLYFCVL